MYGPYPLHKVHFLLKKLNIPKFCCSVYMKGHKLTVNRVSHPAGLISATGCSCMVSSPSFVKAAPAAEKISPT